MGIGRFKLLTKELKSYSRESFKDIYEILWDYKLNKPIIKNSTDELRFLELADKYYLFDIDQCQWDPKHAIYPDPKRKLDVIADKIKEGTVLLSLTDDGHIKGYCRYSINRPDKSVFIEELFTVKEFQRMGVADELLRCVEKRAILQNCDLMMLYVHSNNLGAIAFYNKFGLTEPKDVMFSVTPTYDGSLSTFSISSGVNSVACSFLVKDAIVFFFSVFSLTNLSTKVPSFKLLIVSSSSSM